MYLNKEPLQQLPKSAQIGRTWGTQTTLDEYANNKFTCQTSESSYWKDRHEEKSCIFYDICGPFKQKLKNCTTQHEKDKKLILDHQHKLQDFQNSISDDQKEIHAQRKEIDSQRKEIDGLRNIIKAKEETITSQKEQISRLKIGCIIEGTFLFVLFGICMLHLIYGK